MNSGEHKTGAVFCQAPSVAFIGWNPFQFLHFGRVITRFPDATFIVEKRKATREVFSFDSLVNEKGKLLLCTRKEMLSLDGKFDILVCQTPFAGIENIKVSKIAMLQYGYAKEAHNFAPWRAFADVCLTFGDYASKKIEPFSPSVATGNPRYEEWEQESFHQAARAKYLGQIDPTKKTVLYAPTWGPLSSYQQFETAVLALAKDFNLILKIHHNTQRTGKKHMTTIRRKFGVIQGADDDIVELLSVSDVLISDFSGAIFDAIYCGIPVVLLNTSGAEAAEESKSDLHSIERSRREELGVTVDSPDELLAAVRTALTPEFSREIPPLGLREELFTDATTASHNAAAAILGLANNHFRQTQSQSYIREEMRAYYRSKNQFRSLKTLSRIIGRGAKSLKAAIQKSPSRKGKD